MYIFNKQSSSTYNFEMPEENLPPYSKCNLEESKFKKPSIAINKANKRLFGELLGLA